MEPHQKMYGQAVWLSDIPNTWTLKRISSLFTHRNERVSDIEYRPLSVTKRGVLPQLATAAKTEDNDNRKKVLKGDFVINSRSDRKGSSGLSDLEGSVSLINIVLAHSKLDLRYAHHLLRSYPFQEEFYKWGQGIVADLWSTNYQRMKNIVLPVPPQDEQRKIAEFLDSETAKIDNLVAKQKKLLKLLEEKRRALITHAVTGSYAVASSLWRIRKMKYLVKRSSQRVHASYVGDYIGLEHVGSFAGEIVSPECADKPISYTLLFKKGDVLFGKLNPHLAKVIVAENEGVCSHDFLVLRSNVDINSEFLKYCLLSKRFIDQATAAAYGVKMPRVGWDFIGNMKIAFPDLVEQQTIVDEIKKNEAITKQLISKITTQIRLFEEYRVSLIAHAVIGGVKIEKLAFT